IDRSGNTLTYPGGNAYAYGYSGPHLISVTHNSTGAAVYYTWDQFHNLTSVRTSAEQSPLVSLAYSYADPDARHIASVVATDLLNHQASATFNSWNLPTEIRAVAAAGSGHVDQVARFTYDNGAQPLTAGNLTHLAAAYGTP